MDAPTTRHAIVFGRSIRRVLLTVGVLCACVSGNARRTDPFGTVQGGRSLAPPSACQPENAPEALGSVGDEVGCRYELPPDPGADIGIWLNPDPIREAGGLNLYGFVGNDPQNRVDADGRMFGEIFDWLGARTLDVTSRSESVAVVLAGDFLAGALQIAAAGDIPYSFRRSVDADVSTLQAAGLTGLVASRYHGLEESVGTSDIVRAVDSGGEYSGWERFGYGVRGAVKTAACIVPAFRRPNLARPPPLPTGQAAESLLAAKTAETLPGKLYHYTGQGNAANILENGLQPGALSGKVFTTPAGAYTPIEAQMYLGLSPNRGLPGALFEIDTGALRSMGMNPSAGPMRVLPTPNAMGYGTEIIFDQAIPAAALRQIR